MKITGLFSLLAVRGGVEVRVVGELETDRRVDQVQVSLGRTDCRDHVAEDEKSVDHRCVRRDATADRLVDQLDRLLELALHHQQQHVVEHVAVHLLSISANHRRHLHVEASELRHLLQQTVFPVLRIHADPSAFLLYAFRRPDTPYLDSCRNNILSRPRVRDAATTTLSPRVDRRQRALWTPWRSPPRPTP